MNTSKLDAISAILATVSPVTYKVTTHEHHEHGAVITLDSAGSEVAEDGSDDAAVRQAMGSLGLEFVDSGANGDPEGGYYSHWREVEPVTERVLYRCDGVGAAHPESRSVISEDDEPIAVARGMWEGEAGDRVLVSIEQQVRREVYPGEWQEEWITAPGTEDETIYPWGDAAE